MNNFNKNSQISEANVFEYLLYKSLHDGSVIICTLMLPVFHSCLSVCLSVKVDSSAAFWGNANHTVHVLLALFPGPEGSRISAKATTAASCARPLLVPPMSPSVILTEAALAPGNPKEQKPAAR